MKNILSLLLSLIFVQGYAATRAELTALSTWHNESWKPFTEKYAQIPGAW